MSNKVIDIGEYKVRKGLAPAPKPKQETAPQQPKVDVTQFLNEDVMKGLFSKEIRRPN